MEITGIIKSIKATEKVNEKFSKREFVLTTEASTPYPQHLQIQLTQDKCAVLNQFDEGNEVKVFINLRGREWQDKNTLQTKYFNTIEAWKIEKL